jgi:hypothetical protein
MTREQWLQQLVGELRPQFETLGHPLPEKLRVTCGLPSRRSRSLNKAIGEWFPAAASDDGHDEISVSPAISDPIEVAATLVHELCHAALPGHGHDKEFAKLARKLWLEGKPTATYAGEMFRSCVGPLVSFLGPYPHANLNLSANIKKQSTRMLKAECPCCGYTVRLTAKWAAKGLAHCPLVGFLLALG